MDNIGDRMTDQILEDANRGELWLYDSLDDDTGLYLIHSLRKKANDANCSCINININSPGGKCKYLFPIIDLMETISPSVICTVDHMAVSSAAVILACGDRRLALKNAVIMVHGVAYGNDALQKIPSHEGYLEVVKKMEKRMCVILAQKTHKPQSYWEKIVKSSEDKWFDAEEALEVGLIDEIIS